MLQTMCTVSCPASRIPEEFVIDLSGLELGDSIHFSSIKIDEDITPTISDRDFTIASIVAPAALTSEEENTDDEEVAEGEEAAEGTTDGDSDNAETASKEETESENKKE